VVVVVVIVIVVEIVTYAAVRTMQLRTHEMTVWPVLAFLLIIRTSTQDSEGAGTEQDIRRF
jgi:hypothetical protein